jgi:hypothetical protein
MYELHNLVILNDVLVLKHRPEKTLGQDMVLSSSPFSTFYFKHQININ